MEFRVGNREGVLNRHLFFWLTIYKHDECHRTVQAISRCANEFVGTDEQRVGYRTI